ncbi:MAG TPA: Hpt domain-containing protein, partial [Rubrobacter sp.]|nr:Hpt domain-containing protein [Rubrobacter sp.]
DELPSPESSDGLSDNEGAGDPLDRAAIEDLRELGGQEMFSELARTFIDDAGSNLAALRKSVEEGDASSVELIAHTLVGSSGNMGASRMASICSQIESGASEEPTAALLERLEAEFERVRSALNTEIEAG